LDDKVWWRAKLQNRSRSPRRWYCERSWRHFPDRKWAGRQVGRGKPTMQPWAHDLEKLSWRIAKNMGRLFLHRTHKGNTMPTALVRFGQWREMEATIMSDYVELINPQTMTCRLLKNGAVVAIYKMSQCDKCSLLSKHDDFGYQKGYDATEKIIWFCGGCRWRWNCTVMNRLSVC